MYIVQYIVQAFWRADSLVLANLESVEDEWVVAEGHRTQGGRHSHAHLPQH